MKTDITEIDRQIQQIHAAGRTTLPWFGRAHNYLRMKSRAYYAWHNKPFSSKLHWAILGIQIVALIAIGTSSFVATPVQAAAITWSGGGTDGTCGGNAGDGNKWSCASNWSGGVVPGSADTVAFNNTNNKNSVIDSAFAGSLSGLSMTTYTGTLTFQRDLTTSANFSQSGGTITIQSGTFTVGGTFTQSGGTFTASSGTLVLNSGFTTSGSAVFNSNGGTVLFNATTGGKTITSTSTNTFYNLTFNGVGGSWVVSSALTITNDLTVTSGSLTGTNNLTVNGNVIGNGGTVSLTGGTFEQRVSGAKSFGTTTGSTGWTFFNLTFSNATASTPVTVTTSSLGTGTITVSGALSIGKAADTAATTLDAANRSWTLSGTGGSPFQLLSSPAGVLTPGTSTISYTGNNTSGNTTVAVAPYYNLTVANGTETYVLAGDTAISNNYTQTNGTVDVTASNYAMTVGGSWSKAAGTFTSRSGTVTLNSTSTGKTVTGDMTGTSSFYNLTFNGVGGAWTLSSSGKATTNDLTITNGSVSLASSTPLTVGGSWTNNGSFTNAGQTITFNATTTGKTIAGNLTGANAFSSIVFNGVGGAWSFSSPADVASAFTITNGTVTAPSGNLSLAGSYTNNGSFVHNGGTVVFANTSSSITYTGSMTGSNAFYNFTLNGSGGTLKVATSGSMEVAGDLTLTAGTLSYNTGVSILCDGNVTGTAGVISMGTGSSFEQRASSNATFGTTSGGSAWSFYNLTFSNGNSLPRTISTNAGGSGGVTVGGVLAVGKSGDSAATTLDAGNRTWTLSGAGGTPFQLLASPAAGFTASSSTVTFSGNNASGNTTVPSVTYSTLGVSNTSETFVPTANLTVTNLVIGGGILQLNGSLTINGSYTRTAGNLDVVSGQNYPITVYGSWSGGGLTYQAGNVTFAGSATNVAISGGAFYDLTFSGTGSWAMSGASISVADNLNISSGTVTSTSGTLLVSGSFANTGTFINNGGLVKLASGAGASATVSGSLTGSNGFYNLELDGTVGTHPITVSNNVDVANNFTTAGAAGASVVIPAGITVSVAGDASSGKSVVGSGTLRMTATTGGHVMVPGWGGGTGVENVVFDGVGGSWIIPYLYCNANDAGAVFAKNVSILHGTVSVSNTRSGGCSTSPYVQLYVMGDFVNNDTLLMDDGTLLMVDGNLSGSFTGGNAPYNLRLNAASVLGAAVAARNNIEVSGTLDTNSYALTAGKDFTVDNAAPAAVTARASVISVGGNYSDLGGRLVPASSTLTMTGTGTVSTSGTLHNLTVASSGTVTQANNLTLDGNVTISSGTLDSSPSSYALNLAGNWNGFQSSSYVARASTVTLTGGDQSITGDTTFYKLQKLVSSPATLTFGAASSQTVTGTFTLHGTSGNLLSLRSSSPGTQWNMTTQTAPSIQYLSVKDSHNLSATIVPDSSIVNDGNNTGWQFLRITSISSTSTNTASSLARVGDTVTTSFVSSTALSANPTVTLGGQPMDFASLNGSSYVYKRVISGAETEGASPISIIGTDTAANSASATGSFTLDFTPPAAPTNLTVTKQAGSLALTWTPPSSDLSTTTVYRSTTSGFTPTASTKVATLSVTRQAYTDTSVAGGTTYYYVLVAADVAGNQSAKSNEASQTTDTVPSKLLIALPGQTFASGTGVRGTANPTVAGTPVTVTVYATDSSNRLAPTASGSVLLASSDTQAALPDPVSLGNGQAALTVTLKTAGTPTVTARLTGLALATASQTVTAEGPSALTSSLISQDSRLDLGASGTLVATIRDQYSNPIAGRQAQIVSSRSSDTVTGPAATGSAGTSQATVTASQAGDSTYSLTIDGITLGQASISWAGTPAPASTPTPAPSDTVPPVVRIHLPSLAAIGQVISLSGSDSSDNVGIVSYRWSFPDGSYAVGEKATYLLPQAGDTTVRLTARDAAGNTTTGSASILVTLAAPTNVTAYYQDSSLIVNGSAGKNSNIMALLLPNTRPYLGTTDENGNFTISIPTGQAVAGTYNLTTVAYPQSVSQEHWLAVAPQEVATQATQENSPQSPRVGSASQPIVITLQRDTSGAPYILAGIIGGIVAGILFFILFCRKRRKYWSHVD